jgi:hypothetical protein
MYTCTWEAEARGSRVRGQFGYIVRSCLKNFFKKKKKSENTT